MKIFLFFVVAMMFFSCDKNTRSTDNFHSKTGSALGTTYSILYYAKNEINTSSVDSVFQVVNQSMSTYIPSSDISKINNGDTTVNVDSMFKEVFLLSKKIYEVTEGYFDPTVGKLVNAWGFGPKKLKLKMTQKTVDSLRQYVGFSKLTLDKANRIVKQNKNISLDFNAIAKGYCIDRLAAFLDQQNIKNYLIELGGELVAKGSKIDKNKPWIVGVDDPKQTEVRKLISTLSLTNKAMATSGNYRKFRVDSVTGQKYVHTINPLTGFTEPSSVLSVSVLADNCATADAYATAFMAMPLVKTVKLVESLPELEAYVLFSTSTDSIGKYISKGFQKVLH